MTLLVILICIGLQRYVGLRNTKRIGWLDSYTRVGRSVLARLHLKNEMEVVLFLLAPVILIARGLEAVLEGWWFNLFDFLFNILVLFYCLDARDLKTELTDYFKSRQQDNEVAAFRYGLAFIGSESADDILAVGRAITRKIFLHADLYIFSVLFWYILLGPTGAAVYATVTFLSLQVFPVELSAVYLRLSAAAQIRALLEWIPVRITGLTYAFMGHFAHGFAYWYKNLATGLKKTTEFALDCGFASLELDRNDPMSGSVDANEKTLNLVNRTLVLWIVMIALFTLIAWVS